MRLIAILGGHSSGLIVADTIAALAARGEPIGLAGLLNDSLPAGARIGGHPVLGGFADWAALDDGLRFIAAFPLPGAAPERHRRLTALGIPAPRFATVAHPSAQISPGAQVGPGCYLAANVVVEHGARIAAHVILRAGAYVSHDVQVGEFAFVGPNATLLGRTRLGAGAHLGANAVCRQGTTVHDYALVGIGAVVLRDVEPFAVVAGNPARRLESAGRSAAAGPR